MQTIEKAERTSSVRERMGITNSLSNRSNEHSDGDLRTILSLQNTSRPLLEPHEFQSMVDSLDIGSLSAELIELLILTVDSSGGKYCFLGKEKGQSELLWRIAFEGELCLDSNVRSKLVAHLVEFRDFSEDEKRRACQKLLLDSCPLLRRAAVEALEVLALPLEYEEKSLRGKLDFKKCLYEMSHEESLLIFQTQNSGFPIVSNEDFREWMKAGPALERMDNRLFRSFLITVTTSDVFTLRDLPHDQRSFVAESLLGSSTPLTSPLYNHVRCMAMDYLVELPEVSEEMLLAFCERASRSGLSNEQSGVLIALRNLVDDGRITQDAAHKVAGI